MSSQSPSPQLFFDTINAYQRTEALRAAIEAGKTRFRPVLMTASAMIFGMVPMATGYSQNAPLGRAVIGGLLVATVFTLFFVPCVYAMIYSRQTPRQKDAAS